MLNVLTPEPEQEVKNYLGIYEKEESFLWGEGERG